MAQIFKKKIISNKITVHEYTKIHENKKLIKKSRKRKHRNEIYKQIYKETDTFKIKNDYY